MSNMMTEGNEVANVPNEMANNKVVNKALIVPCGGLMTEGNKARSMPNEVANEMANKASIVPNEVAERNEV